MTYKERMLAAMRGEPGEHMVFAPRLELWYFPNQQAGTLPKQHQGKSHRQISLDEGWALHTVVADYFKQPHADAVTHRAIGVQHLDQHPYRIEFAPPLEAQVSLGGDRIRVTYHTPKGELSTCMVHTAEMKQAGVAVPHIEEHLIKSPADLETACSLFQCLRVVPDEADYPAYAASIGEHGVTYCNFTAAASPMHHIQRYLLEPNQFFFFYKDHASKMQALAESMVPWYEQALKVLAASPVEVINWGANYDDTITYPPYFEKEFLPGIQLAARILHEGGKLLSCHTDGENQGLMDLIASSGMDVAEAVCPAPMTKVSLAEYHRRWSRKGITIFGGIPSSLLLPQSSSWDELRGYMDRLFEVIGDGSRFIAAVADSVPPGADFDRLLYIAERIREDGALPLRAGGAPALSPDVLQRAMSLIGSPKDAREDSAMRDEISQSLEQIGQGYLRLSRAVTALEKQTANDNPASPQKPLDDEPAVQVSHDGPSLARVAAAVLAGDLNALLADLKTLLDQGVPAEDLVNDGMLAAMNEINQRFVDGSVFIPEVLLSARALNQGIALLEPHLGEGGVKSAGKVLVGTVKGDMHDIGKNLVLTMLKGAGFETIDLGMDVPADKFVDAIKQHRPEVLGLSALLTTTMPRMQEVIDALSEAGLRDDLKVIVGGAPVNQQYADEIGADGYAANGGEAVGLVNMLLER